MNESMYEAIAEILGVDVNLIELISPCVGEDTGTSDDFHYGWYVEFPNFENLEPEIQKQIQEYLPEDKFNFFPFGETEYYSDSELGNTKADPFGWKYDDYKFIGDPLPSDETVAELERLKNKISDNETQDSLVIKALVLAAFSLTESFQKGFVKEQIVKANLPDTDKQTEAFVDSILVDILNDGQRRANLLERYTDQALKRIPYWILRNQLAHNIGDMVVLNHRITGEIKGKPFNADVFEIFKQLIALVKEPLKEKSKK